MIGVLLATDASTAQSILKSFIHWSPGSEMKQATVIAPIYSNGPVTFREIEADVRFNKCLLRSFLIEKRIFTGNTFGGTHIVKQGRNKAIVF